MVDLGLALIFHYSIDGSVHFASFRFVSPETPLNLLFSSDWVIFLSFSSSAYEFPAPCCHVLHSINSSTSAFISFMSIISHDNRRE